MSEGSEAGSAVHELRGPARLVVVVTAAASVALAVPGGIGLVFAVPFAAVGGLLAVRRPRTSIGWLLLVAAYGFALLSVPIGATEAQFEAGTEGALALVLAVLSGLLGGLTFLALATLAMSFPSGTLPRGRWGRLARLGVAIGAVFVAFGATTPEIGVTIAGQSATVRVPNPIAIAPQSPVWQVITPDTAIFPLLLLLGAAVVSLAVRFRRSTGVERQQLRWLGAAMILVVLAVLAGFAISAVAPGSGETGTAWIPAMVAFPGVPGAILVAVLRYRLYEIDTLINRALVYGLLTAVLAGASATVIGVTRQLFEGIIGPGSDLSVIVSTLVVVSAFEPIKKRIQALVDRRFREVHSPAAALAAFVADVRRSYARPDLERTLPMFLEAVAAAYHAPGAEATVAVRGAPAATLRAGDAGVEATLRATADAGSTRVTVAVLGGDVSTDAAALEPALAAVLGQLASG